jgi:hypothetical protein
MLIGDRVEFCCNGLLVTGRVSYLSFWSEQEKSEVRIWVDDDCPYKKGGGAPNRSDKIMAMPLEELEEKILEYQMSNPKSYTHPLAKFVGKWVVRNKAVSRTNFNDRSYMSSPIFIEGLGEKVAYYKHSRSYILDESFILAADFCDEHWEEVLPEYAEKLNVQSLPITAAPKSPVSQV